MSKTDKRPARRSLADRIREPEEVAVEVPAAAARSRTRRDFLLFGAGTLAAAGGLWWLLPDDTKPRHLTAALRDSLDSIEARLGATPENRVDRPANPPVRALCFRW